MRFTQLAAAALFALSPVVATAQGAKTIPEVAKSAGTFTTLLTAVEAAGLTETLLGKGPFTVFAPTDEAFAKLPTGTVADLLKPENREKLKGILLYHVVSGKVMAAQASGLTSAETVGGPKLTLKKGAAGLMINEATVRTADVQASNGVIHVIDRVLLPPAK